MDKTIWLILVATVAMIVALAVIFMSKGSISDTISGAENAKKNSICRTKCNALEAGDIDSVSQRCRDWASQREGVSCGG
ncbi:MAG: hypothetical protein ABEI58_00345 [Candidatus Nanohaloarchaea archaeon]